MTGKLTWIIAAAAASLGALFCSAAFAGSQIDRGRYLVQVGGCQDCHTPGNFFGRRDNSRTLGGSDVGFAVHGLGVFVPPNLTPDKTGLGDWTAQQIVTALRTGMRPDGRRLAPAMPWRDFAALTDKDALAIAIYLKSLPPVNYNTPGPFGPGEKPTVFVMAVSPPPK
jgi:mono/diheme cytochrome c family protein